MAKIRTVKPELFRHEDLFESEQRYQLPLRLAFIGLFTCCDRAGRFRWRPRQLKLDIFPYDSIDMVHVLEALVSDGFIWKYEVEGEVYGCIPSWHKHQCINHREGESDLPTPIFSSNNISTPGETENLSENVSILDHNNPNDASLTREARVEHASRACPGTPRRKGNGTGSGNGRELEREIGMQIGHASPPKLDQHDELVKVFSYWKSVMDHPNAQLDAKRRMVIRKAIQAGYSVSQLCQAIEGCSYTPYNMGKNDAGQRYDGLHVIFRDADQIDRFIRNCQEPPRQLNAAQQRSASNIDVLQSWVEKKIWHDADMAEVPHG